MKMLAKKAVQNPETLKPLTSDATSKIISALITSKNRPKVSSVSGKVNRINKGRTIAFAKPNNKADTNKDDLFSNTIP